MYKEIVSKNVFDVFLTPKFDQQVIVTGITLYVCQISIFGTFFLQMLKIEKLNLHLKSYMFSESFTTFWELQTPCLWKKLNFKESCNACHDAQKQLLTERYKLIVQNSAVVTLLPLETYENMFSKHNPKITSPTKVDQYALAQVN